MRITLLFGGSYVSGMEIKTLNMLSALKERGHDVYVVASGWNDGDFVGRLAERGIAHETIYLGKLTKSLKPEHIRWMADTIWRLPGALLAMRRHLRAFRPDVVVLFNRDSALLAASVLRGWPCVFHVAELQDITPWTQWMYGRIDGFVARWIGVSNYIGARLPAFGIAPETVHVVHNGIPESVVADRIPSPEGVVRIGICGQVGPWKGHDDLLAALGLLHERGCPFRCLVFGRGEEAYVDSLQRETLRLGIDALVEWHGFVKSLPEMYAQVDVLAAPTRTEEPFGLVAAEAGLNGIPVVVSRRGGLPEIVVDGETGFVVEAERPDLLANRLERLIDSPELRATMGAAGRERVHTLFTVDRMAEGHEHVFAMVVR